MRGMHCLLPWIAAVGILIASGCASQNQAPTAQKENASQPTATQQQRGQNNSINDTRTTHAGTQERNPALAARLQATYTELGTAQEELAAAITNVATTRRTMHDYIAQSINNTAEQQKLQSELQTYQAEYQSKRQTSAELMPRIENCISRLIQLGQEHYVTEQIMKAAEQKLVTTAETQDKQLTQLKARIMRLQDEMQQLKQQVGSDTTTARK